MSVGNWDLSDIYESLEDKSIDFDKTRVETLVLNFKNAYFNNLNEKNLLGAIRDYEKIQSLIEKLSAYSFLYLQTKLNDEKVLSFFQKTTEWISVVSSDIVFFDVAITNLDFEEVLSECDKNAELNAYRSWIEHSFKFKEHVLTNEAESAVFQKNITSRSSWIRLYDEILVRLRFDLEGEEKNLAEIVEIANHSKDSVQRKKASISLSNGLQKESFYIKTIYNNIILDCSVENKIRKYSYPEESRHLSNNIDKKSVDFLSQAVVLGYKNTSHRYYAIKAKILGKEKLEYSDRNAPVNLSGYLDKKYSYEEAAKIVCDGYEEFCPLFSDIAKEFISKNWIDVYPFEGKTSGAFSHHCSCEIHPYILLNFFGNIRDVSTLAHELGHGIHQKLSASNGPILSDTPITLSEVASLFGEKIIFEKLLKNTTNNLEKIDLLCSKLDDTINSVIRQIAFFEFEKKVHLSRLNSELSVNEISSYWVETQKQALGEFVILDDNMENYWCYISHFFHCPFYVYAYAFGEIFVNALYENYKKDKENFVEKYVKMLSRGGIDKYDIAAKAFDLNPLDSDFWYDGVKSIENQVNELEDLCGCSLRS